MLLTNASPCNGARWTNNGKPRERRPLKHRAEGGPSRSILISSRSSATTSASAPPTTAERLNDCEDHGVASGLRPDPLNDWTARWMPLA